MPQDDAGCGKHRDSTGEAIVQGEVIAVIMFGLIVVAALAIIWMGMNSRRQIREMEHRERLAMIERGLVPPPEVDPAGFERRLGTARGEDTRPQRFRSAGVILIGLGAALAVLLIFTAGVPAVGLGIGLAFAALGGAFLANAAMLSQSQPLTPPPAQPPMTHRPPESDR
jgi:hypothetical protein